MAGDELKAFVAYLRTILGSASALCVFAPLILRWLAPELIPPWPSKIEFLVGGVCAFVILALFFGIRHQSFRRKLRWGQVLSVVTIIMFGGWFAAASNLTVEVTDEYRVVKGFSLQKHVEEDIRSGKIVNVPKDLLGGYGWKSAERIWHGVRLARTIVGLSFLITFAAAAGTLASFALQDFRREGH